MAGFCLLVKTTVLLHFLKGGIKVGDKQIQNEILNLLDELYALHTLVRDA
jgi:hypothetical protein